MKPGLKKFLNLLPIIGTLAIVLYIGLSGQELGNAVTALHSMSPLWIILCAAAYGCYVCIEAASICFFLHRHGYPISYSYGLFVAITGAYYSNITPGATGGQPMQIYYLNKRGVPIGIGTAALIVKLFCFQSMLQVLATIGWLINGPYVMEQLSGNMWILIVGYVYNAVTIIFMIMMICSRRLVTFFIDLFIRIGRLLHIVKDPASSRVKWLNSMEIFHSSAMMLLRNPVDLLVQLLLGGLQLLAHTIIVYFIYCAFQMTGSSGPQIVTLALLQYISAAYTPLPGASGAQEGVFALYFSGIFPDGIRFMALLLWRFFTYYLMLAIGALTTVIYGLQSNHKVKPQS